MEKNSNIGDVKRLVLSLCMLLLFMAVVVLTNVLVDPANLFRDTVASEAADIMVSGSNVTNITNLDDRLLLQYYSERRTQPIEVLGLGSSRIMQLTDDMVQGDYFGAGVTGSDLRDVINNYYMFKERVGAPQKVIIALDYWFLSSGNLNGLARTEYYEQFCADVDSDPVGVDLAVDRYVEMLSFVYFQNSIDTLLSDREDIAATELTDDEGAVRRADGSYSYSLEYREGGVSQSNQYAYESTVLNGTSAVFDGVKQTLQQQFSAFLQQLSNDGVDIEFVIVPFHPIYYDFMLTSEKYTEILATEDYFREVAQQFGIEVKGSYNPHTLQFTSAEFYDAMHVTQSAMQQLYTAE